MSHLSYSESKKKALVIITILAVITVCEVIFALLGKGYIIEGLHFPLWIMALVMIVMSIYKAYLVVYEFMHMKYEVSGLRMTVLLPMLLLVWTIIAFFSEGSSWFERRDQIKQKNEAPMNKIGMSDDTFQPEVFGKM